MAEDPFYLRKIYPVSEGLFSTSQKPLKEITDTALVSFDTNVLLRPYLLKENTFLKIGDIYRKLANEGRVVITGHVAREFSKHRDSKIADIIVALENASSGARSPLAVFPMLSELEEYKNCESSSKKAEKAASDFQKDVRKLVALVSGWRGDDPVSAIYRDVFTPDRVVDIDIDQDGESKIVSDAKWREENRVAPGFQDDRIGDLLIWKTLLDSGRKFGRDLIFVTNDQKNDWWVQGNGKALFPKRELIEEYRASSGGREVHLMTFAQFLAEFDAGEEVVDAVKAVDAEASEAESASRIANMIWSKALTDFSSRPSRTWSPRSFAAIDRLRANPKGVDDPEFLTYRSRLRDQARAIFDEIRALEALASKATAGEASRIKQSISQLEVQLSSVESMLRLAEQELHDAQIADIY